MTARQLISNIVNSCQDLDGEIPLFMLTRDEGNCVTDQKSHYYSFVNGKICVEERDGE